MTEDWKLAVAHLGCCDVEIKRWWESNGHIDCMWRGERSAPGPKTRKDFLQQPNPGQEPIRSYHLPRSAARAGAAGTHLRIRRSSTWVPVIRGSNHRRMALTVKTQPSRSSLNYGWLVGRRRRAAKKRRAEMSMPGPRREWRVSAPSALSGTISQSWRFGLDLRLDFRKISVLARLCTETTGRWQLLVRL